MHYCYSNLLSEYSVLHVQSLYIIHLLQSTQVCLLTESPEILVQPVALGLTEQMLMRTGTNGE